MNDLIERIKQARDLLNDKPKGTEIEISLSKVDLRRIHMALRLWNYGDKISDEELDFVHR